MRTTIMSRVFVSMIAAFLVVATRRKLLAAHADVIDNIAKESSSHRTGKHPRQAIRMASDGLASGDL